MSQLKRKVFFLKEDKEIMKTGNSILKYQSVLIFLVGQILGGIVYLIKLDSRVRSLEESNIKIEQKLSELDKLSLKVALNEDSINDLTKTIERKY